jgi:hypothetical protein
MSARPVLRTILYWHVRKGRRIFDLLAIRLASPRSLQRTGVRWG